MRYAGMIKNDMTAGEGVCVSFFTQGCPFHCKGCHNPETWDFDGGKEFTPEIMNELLDAISANGIQRNLAIMGGEPLCPGNQMVTQFVISTVREIYPDIKIYLWTGYTWEQLAEWDNYHINRILNEINVLIDGPYIEEERDITLPMRGSRNQRIIQFD